MCYHSGSNQINPFGFMEKKLNMHSYTNIIESKPLRDILKLVMFKIIEKLLKELRRQQRTWGIENLKSYKHNEFMYKYNEPEILKGLMKMMISRKFLT